MKLDKADIIGLLLLFIGVVLVFLEPVWTPFVAVGIVIVLVGLFLWDPFGFFFSNGLK